MTQVAHTSGVNANKMFPASRQFPGATIKVYLVSFQALRRVAQAAS